MPYKVLVLPCKHEFCEGCISEVGHKSSEDTIRCPLCRDVFNKSVLGVIF
jgi:hypothetical protein